MSRRPELAAVPGHFAKAAALVAAATCLVLWASPPTALVAGLALWRFVSVASLLAICGPHLAS
jgi:hypothetical protein